MPFSMYRPNICEVNIKGTQVLVLCSYEIISIKSLIITAKPVKMRNSVSRCGMWALDKNAVQSDIKRNIYPVKLSGFLNPSDRAAVITVTSPPLKFKF